MADLGVRLYMDTLFAIIIRYFTRTADLCGGISMDAAEKRPEIVKGVIMLGPITDMTKSAANFENAARSHYTEREKKKVDAICGSAPLEYFSLVAENLAEKYTNCAHYKGKEVHDSLTMKWMLRWLTSKDWKFSNLIGTMKAASTFGKKYSALWNSLLQINITESLYYLKMPGRWSSRQRHWLRE